MNKILNIIEEIINELNDSTVDSLYKKRKQIANMYNNHLQGFKFEPSQQEEIKKKAEEADRKLGRTVRAIERRNYRQNQKKMEEASDKFMDAVGKTWGHNGWEEESPAEKLENSYKNNVATKQAKTDQENAQIRQGLVNQLEKAYKKRSRKNPHDTYESLSNEELFTLIETLIYETSVAWKTTRRQKAAQASLPGREKEANEKMKSFNNAVNSMERSLEQSGDVTQSQIRAANQIAKDADRAQSRATAARKVLKESLNLLTILEGDVVDFSKKKKEIEDQRERDDIANEVNGMMSSGEMRKVRQTSTGNLIGNPETVKKLYGLKDRLKKLCGEE